MGYYNRLPGTNQYDNGGTACGEPRRGAAKFPLGDGTAEKSADGGGGGVPAGERPGPGGRRCPAARRVRMRRPGQPRRAAGASGPVRFAPALPAGARGRRFLRRPSRRPAARSDRRAAPAWPGAPPAGPAAAAWSGPVRHSAAPCRRADGGRRMRAGGLARPSDSRRPAPPRRPQPQDAGKLSYGCLLFPDGCMGWGRTGHSGSAGKRGRRMAAPGRRAAAGQGENSAGSGEGAAALRPGDGGRPEHETA